MPFQLPTAVVRFPRRYPLSLLVLLIPLSLTLYYNFGYLNAITRYRLAAPPSTSKEDPLTNAGNTNSSTPPNEVLLVTAFYPLDTSNHDSKSFANLLGKIRTEVYFFTTPAFEPTVRKSRGPLPITIDSTFPSPFDIPQLTNRRDSYKDMQRKDRERSKQPLEIYAARNAKPYFLAEALRRSVASGKSPKYIFWVDAESFGGKHAYMEWPSVERLDAVWAEGRRDGGARLEDMFFIPVWEMPHPSMSLWTEAMGPITSNFVDSSFFGGMTSTVFWWEKYFYAYHDFYLDQVRTFVGKDVSLVNSLMLLHPERVITVWHNDLQSPARVYTSPKPGLKDLILGDCGDPRRYFQFFLASESEQDANRKMWDRTWNWRFWDVERWFRQRESCRVTRLLPMEWLLRRPFGDTWRSPEGSVSSS